MGKLGKSGNAFFCFARCYKKKSEFIIHSVSFMFLNAKKKPRFPEALNFNF